MKLETKLFLYLAPFFLVVAAIYGVWSRLEPVGTAGMALVGGLMAMIGFYLGNVARRIDPRPEDNAYAEVEDGAGDQGIYSPWSWWPLVLGLAAAIAFASLAIGWWLLAIGAALGVIGLVGWVYEFSRGQHAH
jgi:hypothetical protein